MINDAGGSKIEGGESPAWGARSEARGRRARTRNAKGAVTRGLATAATSAGDFAGERTSRHCADAWAEKEREIATGNNAS